MENPDSPPKFDEEDGYALWSRATDRHDEEIRLSHEANRCLRRRDWQRAQELYYEIVRHPIPNLAVAYADDADGASKLAEWETGMRRWRAYHWARYGAICLWQRDRETARSAFRTALTADADCPEAWAGLFNDAVRSGQWRKSWEYLTHLYRSVGIRRNRERIEARTKDILPTIPGE